MTDHDAIVASAVSEVATIARTELDATERANALQAVANNMAHALAENPDPNRRDDRRPLAVVNVARCAEHAARNARPRP